MLTAYERTDKKHAIYTRIWNGLEYRGRKVLCGPIRDANGQIVPEKEIEAQTLTVERHAGLSAGIEEEEIIQGTLTLAGGFRRVLHPDTGKYPADSEQKAEVTRASKVITTILGPEVRWSSIKHAHYRKLWRHLAHAHRKEGQYGHRMAEVICEALQSAARWLQQEGLIEPGEGEAARGWHQSMKREWEEITGLPVPERKKPRHSDGEKELLWKALPNADPRLWLAVELGAELRLGQVIARTRRSDVHPSPDGKEPLWKVIVHGRGKKLGETVVLTEDQRAVLKWALEEGHLAELEADRVAGEIADFYLMPGGPLVTRKLADGRMMKRVPPERGQRPLGDTGLAKQWKKLEIAANVPYLRGRRWYGMRRRQADAADKLDIKPQVKNRMGGWSKTSTREGYLEEGRIEDAIDAMEARSKIRPRKELSSEESQPPE